MGGHQQAGCPLADDGQGVDPAVTQSMLAVELHGAHCLLISYHRPSGGRQAFLVCRKRMGFDGVMDPSSLAGACGAYCGACLAFDAELATEAQALLTRIRRQGFLSLARRLQPGDGPKIEHFFDVLDRLARTPACPGCAAGGGPADCPVRSCARRRQLPTCAPCPDLTACARGELGSDAQVRQRHRRDELRGAEPCFPFSASAYMLRLARKYQGWNLENLKRSQREGLEAWAADLARQVAEGFRSVEIKSDEDIYVDD